MGRRSIYTFTMSSQRSPAHKPLQTGHLSTSSMPRVSLLLKPLLLASTNPLWDLASLSAEQCHGDPAPVCLGPNPLLRQTFWSKKADVLFQKAHHLQILLLYQLLCLCSSALQMERAEIFPLVEQASPAHRSPVDQTPTSASSDL